MYSHRLRPHQMKSKGKGQEVPIQKNEDIDPDLIERERK